MFERERVRLLILLFLQGQNQYLANQEPILKHLINLGYSLSRDQLHIELNWLDQVADALVVKISGGVYIVSLTGDGLEVAEGIKTLPGIAKPLPGDLAHG